MIYTAKFARNEKIRLTDENRRDFLKVNISTVKEGMQLDIIGKSYWYQGATMSGYSNEIDTSYEYYDCVLMITVIAEVVQREWNTSGNYTGYSTTWTISNSTTFSLNKSGYGSYSVYVDSSSYFHYLNVNTVTGYINVISGYVVKK